MYKWTTEEISILKNNYLNLSDRELKQLLHDKSITSISSKRREMGLTKRKKKYTFDDVIKEFSKHKEYILLSNKSEYNNCSSKMRYICTSHKDKGEQSITLSHIMSGRGCYYCGRDRTEKAHILELDKDFDKKLCEAKNFEYIDTIRENNKITITFICKKHQELGEQHMTKYNMKRDIKGCKFCCGKKLPEWYVLKKAKEINPHIKLLEPYSCLTKRISCICTKHNHSTHKTMQDILKGKGCYYCGLEKLSEQQFLSLNDYQKKVFQKNPNIKVLNYNGIRNNAKFQCSLCGETWKSCATSIRQCHNCMNYYTGEKQISDFLDMFNIQYIQQYKFQDCKDKRPLPFDFYLPQNNICIEFDGEQHFKQRKGWTDLKIIQSHDKIKTDFCKNNNIVLIRIPYWEQDDLENYLFDKLVEHGALIEVTHVA